MAPEPEDAAPRDDAARRAAQDSVDELARMGIDPRDLGLEPVGPPLPPAPPPRTVRGVASPPATTRTAPAPPGARRGSTTYGRATPAPPADPYPAPPAPPPPPASAPPPPPATPAWVDSTLSRPIGGLPRPPAPAAVDYTAPLERIVTAATPAPPGGWRRLLRAVTFGLVEPGAAAAAEYERQLVARVRLRRPEPRVVAFLAGKGGVGTSTTIAGVALTLATLRHDTTALVSARSGTGSLGQRLLGRPAPPVAALVDGDPAPEPLWLHGTLAVVDGAPWHTPIPPGSLVTLLERLRGRHPLTLVDLGNDLGEPADGTLGRADQVVLVTSASQDAVAATRVALSRVHQVDPFRLATVVVALTCLSERQFRRTARRLRTELGMRGGRIVPVPFDPWLASGDRIEPARLRAATREAYLRLAGLVVEPGAPDQWFSQPPRERGGQ